MEKIKNIFYKVIYVLILIVLLVVLAFVLKKAEFILNKEILIYIGIITVYVLAPEFDKLSINNIVSISKNIKELEKNTEDIKKTNDLIVANQIELKNSIMNLQNQFVQNNNSQVVNIPSKIIIQTSNLSDLVKTKLKENEDTHEEEQKVGLFKVQTKKANNDINPAYLELCMLNEVLREFEDKTIHYNIKFKGDTNLNNIYYDAMVRTGTTSRVFIESKIPKYASTLNQYIEKSLKGLEVYSKNSKADIKLIIVIPKGTNYKKSISLNNTLRPYIENNQLEIREVEVTKEDIEKYVSELII